MADNAVNFVIGVFVSLGASFMDALGLNILKLDHVKEGQKDASSRRGDCGRPLWHIGLYTYVASQLIGSTIALSSVALIYNFIFAKILVGTNITRKDVLGTLVVVASVIWIVVFGGMYNGEDPEASISLEKLKTLFTRPIFIIYFSALNIITVSGLALAIWSRWTISDESKRPAFMTMSPKKMRRIVGLMFSLDGGLLASETLLLAKSGQVDCVKLFTLSVSSQVNQFTDNTSRFIILALIITAILQVYCLNTALKLYSSVVVVPVFYGTYTAVGLVNTIIYLDEIGNYPGWAISLVFVGIGVLIYGVYLLSAKPDPNSHLSNQDDDDALDQSPQQQQIMVITPTEQEMYTIQPSSAPTSSRPPHYYMTTTSNHIPSIHNTDEKSPYPAPLTTMPKSVTPFSHAATTSSEYQQHQPFESAIMVDEALAQHPDYQQHGYHATAGHYTGRRWIRQLISKVPWRTIHRREDTFLSLHSTGSTSLPATSISISPSSSAALPRDNATLAAPASASDPSDGTLTRRSQHLL